MTKKIFQQRVIQEFNRRYGEKYRSVSDTIFVANDIWRDVIVIYQIKNEKSKTCIAFDWEQFIDMTEGTDYPMNMVGNIVREVAHAMVYDKEIENRVQWDTAKKKLRVRMVNYKKSRKFLAETPHRKYLDLAVAAYIETESKMSILVRNYMLSEWGKTADEVLQQAEANMKELFCIQDSLVDMILKLYQREYDSGDGRAHGIENSIANGTEDGIANGVKNGMESGIANGMKAEIRSRLGEDSHCGMYVVKYDSPAYGASAILEPSNFAFLEQNAYIIASNCHELIVIPESEAAEEQDMRRMVREINRTDLLAEEVLSDNLYYYNYAENGLSLC